MPVKKESFRNHPLRNTWKNMIRRCYCVSDKDFKNYGGRGIKICIRWHSIENFIKDMEPKISKDLTLDRIDVNGNYEPKNVRWASKKEQTKNRRINYENTL